MNEVKRPAEHLKAKRIEKGLSQYQFAELLSMDRRNYIKYETGERDINKMQAIKLKHLADVLNCKMEDLLELEEE